MIGYRIVEDRGDKTDSPYRYQEYVLKLSSPVVIPNEDVRRSPCRTNLIVIYGNASGRYAIRPMGPAKEYPGWSADFEHAWLHYIEDMVQVQEGGEEQLLDWKDCLKLHGIVSLEEVVPEEPVTNLFKL